MRLWMICPETTLEALRPAGTLLCDPAMLDPDFDSIEYPWMRSMMRRRIPSYQGPSIWWAWHTLDGVAGKRPDLRDRQRFHWCEPGSRWARVGLELPDHEVLLSDFELWHFVLNRSYLSFDEAERDAWDALHEGDRIDPDTPPCAEVMASWERIFTIEQGAFDPRWVGRVGRNVQATFEVLRWADVREVTAFTGRPPLRW